MRRPVGPARHSLPEPPVTRRPHVATLLEFELLPDDERPHPGPGAHHHHRLAAGAISVAMVASAVAGAEWVTGAGPGVPDDVVQQQVATRSCGDPQAPGRRSTPCEADRARPSWRCRIPPVAPLWRAPPTPSAEPPAPDAAVRAARPGSVADPGACDDASSSALRTTGSP